MLILIVMGCLKCDGCPDSPDSLPVFWTVPSPLNDILGALAETDRHHLHPG